MRTRQKSRGSCANPPNVTSEGSVHTIVSVGHGRWVDPRGDDGWRMVVYPVAVVVGVVGGGCLWVRGGGCSGGWLCSRGVCGGVVMEDHIPGGGDDSWCLWVEGDYGCRVVVVVVGSCVG